MGNIDEISKTLGRIEGALEGIHREQQRVAEYTIAISGRLSTVEQRQSRILGWAGGAGALAAAVVSATFKLLKGS